MLLHTLGYVGLALIVVPLVAVIVQEGWEALERKRRRADIHYERYVAEQAIRDNEHRTIQDMLAVYRREARSDDEVIEGTCREVRRT